MNKRGNLKVYQAIKQARRASHQLIKSISGYTLVWFLLHSEMNGMSLIIASDAAIEVVTQVLNIFPTIVWWLLFAPPPKLEQKFDSHRRQFLSQFAQLKMPPNNHNFERAAKSERWNNDCEKLASVSICFNPHPTKRVIWKIKSPQLLDDSDDDTKGGGKFFLEKRIKRRFF